MVRRYNQLVEALMRTTDVAVAAFAWVLAYGARYLGGEIGLSHHPLPDFGDFLSPMIFSLVLVPLIFSRFGMYIPKRTKSLGGEMADMVRCVATVWVLTYVFANLTREVMISRLMMMSLLVVWVSLGTVSRLLARMMLRWFRRRGWNQRRAVIIGTGRLAQKLCHAIRRNTWTGIDVDYLVGEGDARGKLGGLDVLGPVEDIDAILSRRPVDIAFVAMSGPDGKTTEQVLSRLATSTVDVRVVPDLLSFHFLGQDVSQLENLPIISLTHSPQHGWNSLLKSAFDLAASAVGLVVMAIPMLIIAAAIKLTGHGPVFYRQKRTSLAGKEFMMIKFRTMIRSAEFDTGAVWALPEDPRVTPVGRFLRRTGLDELPQLFNVLTARMSLVGPRPERPEFIERFRRQVPRYMLRNQVKAGLTGWAQVHGLRGRTSLRKRLQYDLYYITNWTFGLDLRILLMTVFRVFFTPRRGGRAAPSPDGNE